MRKAFSNVCIVVVIVSISAALPARLFAADPPLYLIPWPKSVTLADGRLNLPASSRIIATDPKLLPLAVILADDIYRATGVTLQPASADSKPGDIVLNFDPALKSEASALVVTDSAKITGENYRAVSWGAMTLLQALADDGGHLSLPKMNISDDTDIKMRSCELDIARKWHPIETLYELVDLFQFYKLNCLQLHMVDHGMITFGSELYPELGTVAKDGTKHYYTKQELKDLVAYADARGVTLIPEIEMPGHSDAPHILPKIFGSKDATTGDYHPKGQGLICVERPETVEACKALLNEVMDVFQSSPYVSIGADEVPDAAFTRMSEYPDFQKAHPGLNPLDYFVTEMNNAVKKRGKMLLVYGRGGPSDVLQMPWTGNDNKLATDGYQIIPYTTGSVTHHLTTFYEPPYNTFMLYSGFQAGYEFDLAKDRKITPENMPKIFGFQILTWQNWHYVEFSDLRKTMAAVAENSWNYNTHDKFKPFDQWRDTMWAATNQRLDDIVFPVKVQADGLLSPGKDLVFYKNLTVKLSSARQGTIHITMEKLDYFAPPALPTMQSPAYTTPIQITQPTVVYARLFDQTGKPVGFGTEVRYYPITPVVECSAYTIDDIHKAMNEPDPEGLLPIDAEAIEKLDVKPKYVFPMGRLSIQPSYEGVFRKDSVLVEKGQIKILAAGSYTFTIHGAFTSLQIDGRTVVSVGTDAATLKLHKVKQNTIKEATGTPVQLAAGLHTFAFMGACQSNTPKTVEVTDASGKSVALDQLMILLPNYTAP